LGLECLVRYLDDNNCVSGTITLTKLAANALFTGKCDASTDLVRHGRCHEGVVVRGGFLEETAQGLECHGTGELHCTYPFKNKLITSCSNANGAIYFQQKSIIWSMRRRAMTVRISEIRKMTNSILMR